MRAQQLTDISNSNESNAIQDILNNVVDTISKDLVVDSGAAYTIDPVNSKSFGITLTSATPILTFAANPASGEESELSIDIIQDGVGGRLPSFVNATYATGSAPNINQASGAITYLAVKGTSRGWIIYANTETSVITSSVPSGTPVTLTSTVIADVTSITLPAGDWDIRGSIIFNGGAVTATQSQGFFGTVAGNNTTGRDLAKNTVSTSFGSSATSPLAMAMPVFRVTPAVSTTYYLKANSTFSVGTATAYGTIEARRMG